MTSRPQPPFELRLRVGRGSGFAPDTVSLKRLREVVAGRDTSFSRAAAIDLLVESDFPGKHRDLEAVLANEREAPWIRYVAAMGLGRLDHPKVEEILIRNTHTDDARVLVGVTKALGYAGGTLALDAVGAVKARAGGLVAATAGFAATLIAHRLGCEGHDVPVPGETAYLDLHPAAGRSIQFARGRDLDVEFCLRSLAGDPLGVEFAERPAYRIRCGRAVWMLLFNREFAGQDALDKLRLRKALLGVLASRNPSDGHYSPAFVLLTSAAGRGASIHLLLCRLSGTPALGGAIHMTANGAHFRVRAIARPGAVPVEIEGVWKDDRIEIVKALSGMVVQGRREPLRG